MTDVKGAMVTVLEHLSEHSDSSGLEADLESPIHGASGTSATA